MLGRITTLLAVAFLGAVPASADPKSYCSGKYVQAADLVDHAVRRFNTLYSGGNFFPARDNIWDTLNIYRFWKGWAPVVYKGYFTVPDWRPGDFSEETEKTNQAKAPEIWEKASWALHEVIPAETDKRQYFWAGWGLDVITVPDATPDWWRDPAAVAKLQDSAAWIAEKARTEPGLDWLQMIVAASAAPWAQTWRGVGEADKPARDGYHRIAEAAFGRYRNGEGVEWLVAAAINEPAIARNGPLGQELASLREEVRSCTATPQRYAAYAVALPFVERDMPEHHIAGDPLYVGLPETVRHIAAYNGLERFVLDTIAGRKPAIGLDVYRTAGIDRLKPSVELAQLYTASRIEDVPASSHTYARRIYNIMSADNLSVLAQKPGADPMIPRVAFARHVALGNVAKAGALLPQLKAASPADAAEIDRIWAGPGTEAQRLALIMLVGPGLPTMFRGGDSDETYGDFALILHWDWTARLRNLPTYYRSDAYVQRDFETWLKLPQRFQEYHGLHGYQLDWMQRMEMRSVGGSTIAGLPAPLSAGLPFRRFLDIGEARQLTGAKALMVTIAPHVIAWAEARIAARGEKEATAEALRRLIVACRYDECGMVNNVPAGKRAFQMLKSGRDGLAETKAARHVRWWFKIAPES